MSEFQDRYMRQNAPAGAYTGAVDEGLRKYMLGIYNYMALGVAGTAVVTLFMAANPQLMASIAMGPMVWVVFAILMGIGFFGPRMIMNSGSAAVAHGVYWAYVAAWGVMISPMIYSFLQSEQGTMDIARAFFITSAVFAGVSIFGYTTKKNLSAFATFFTMATIGLLIAIIVNAIFIQSTMMSLFTSCAVVLVFSGITAWETQMLKQQYYQAGGNVARLSIFGAMSLYGSFITLFIHILNILGIMRD